MKVQELLRGKHLLTIKGEDTLDLAGQLMAWGGLRHLPVLKDGRLIGLLSERDVLRAGGAAHARLVRDEMSAPVQVATPDEDLSEVEERFVSEKVGCMPVLEKGRLVGLLTPGDLLAEQLQRGEAVTGGERVRDAMTPQPLTAAADDLLLDAAARMADRGVRHLPVVDGDRRVLGMLSDADVRTAVGDPRRALAQEEQRGRAVNQLRVSDVMSAEAVVIAADAPLDRAVDLLVAHRVGALPVVGPRGELVGVLSYLDVLKRHTRTH
ncbi:MAG TPA: CBS domain-containing protein [Myxococcales bacterium]|nr:CBS domain-containing protein [Myxococcales bacterium]